jgi:hypothetical protein
MPQSYSHRGAEFVLVGWLEAVLVDEGGGGGWVVDEVTGAVEVWVWGDRVPELVMVPTGVADRLFEGISE